MSFFGAVVTWLFYWGLTVAVLMFDRKRARQKAEAAGTPDFMDRSLFPYLIFGILCGPVPLIVYFGSTRRSAVGWLLGVGAFLGVFAGTVLVAGGLQWVFQGAGSFR